LGGIAAAIGLLIDDVIVMIEHIARRVGVPGLSETRAAVFFAAREFFSPLLGSSLATIRAHGRLLRILFAYPVLAVIVILALGSAGYIAYTRVGTGFPPRMDEGGFVLDYQTAPWHFACGDEPRADRNRSDPEKEPLRLHLFSPNGAGLGGDQ